VIAIAAARLGFGPVLAVDHDPAALEATSRNARANGVELELSSADALAGPLPPVEVIVANISESSVRQLVPDMATRAVIASGYLESERPSLPGFEAAERRVLQGWAADLFRRAE